MKLYLNQVQTGGAGTPPEPAMDYAVLKAAFDEFSNRIASAIASKGGNESSLERRISMLSPAVSNWPKQVYRDIETGSFTDSAGLILPQQQVRFVQQVRAYGGLLPWVTTYQMKSPTEEVSYMKFGEPVMEAASENSQAQYDKGPKVYKKRISAVKTRTSYGVTTEVMVQNIEKGIVEDTIMSGISKVFAFDTERLGIMGDTTLPDTTPMNKLLRIADGWIKLCDNGGATVIDWASKKISMSLFREMILRMPREYQGNPNLYFILSRSSVMDYLDLLSSRPTALGDRAIEGQLVGPYGLPILPTGVGDNASRLRGIPTIPDTLPLSVLPATPAEIIGTMQDPFVIVTGTNTALNFTVTDGVVGPVTFGVLLVNPGNGAMTIRAIVDQLNVAFVAAGFGELCTHDTDGRIMFRTINEGAAQNITINNVANNAYATLGLTVGVYPGSDSGAAGTVYEGTIAWLTDPKDLVFQILFHDVAGGAVQNDQGVRINAKYDQDYDILKVVMYTYIGFSLLNEDGILMAKNIRKGY